MSVVAVELVGGGCGDVAVVLCPASPGGASTPPLTVGCVPFDLACVPCAPFVFCVPVLSVSVHGSEEGEADNGDDGCIGVLPLLLS